MISRLVKAACFSHIFSFVTGKGDVVSLPIVNRLTIQLPMITLVTNRWNLSLPASANPESLEVPGKAGESFVTGTAVSS